MLDVLLIFHLADNQVVTRDGCNILIFNGLYKMLSVTCEF